MPSDDILSMVLSAPPTILALLLGLGAVGVTAFALYVVLRTIPKGDSR